MHPLILLPLATFILLLLWLCWSWLATKRSQKKGKTTGIGGPNDPMV